MKKSKSNIKNILQIDSKNLIAHFKSHMQFLWKTIKLTLGVVFFQILIEKICISHLNNAQKFILLWFENGIVCLFLLFVLVLFPFVKDRQF